MDPLRLITALSAAAIAVVLVVCAFSDTVGIG